MIMEKLTDRLIDFALNFKTEDIPQYVIDNQKKVLTDSLGVMTAATTLEPATRPFTEYALESSGPSSVIGTGKRSTPVLAAMANGALIHALDYEDGHDISHAHPNTATIPAVLAFAEAEGKSGKEALAAMVIGSEISVRLKMCLTGNDLRDCGWYSPPMFAAYGAVLGVSRLLGFTHDQTRDALSVCMTQISLPGMSARSKESVLRGIREALSAKAAAFGAEMARRGVKARMDEPFEGEFGLFMSCFRNMYDEKIIFDGLGERWECTGLRFKAWPCCGTSHGTVDAIIELIRQNGIKPEEVKEVHLHVNKPHMNLLEPRDVKYHPGSLAAAKFSLPFTVALVLKYGNVTLDLYKEDILKDEELLRLSDSVTFEMRPADIKLPEHAIPDDYVIVEIKTDRGTFSRETIISSGSPFKPLTDDQIKNKFFDCCSFGVKRFDAQKVYEEVSALDKKPDLSGLFAAVNS